MLEAQEQAFVLAVTGNEPLWCNVGRGVRQERVADMVASRTEDVWQRLSAGDGAKVPRLYDWAGVALELLTWLQDEEPRWEHWLLVRRNIEKPKELAYYVVFFPVGTTFQELVQVAGKRRTIEESFEITKDEVGLDQYEVRRWTGWYRHITHAMLAQVYLAVTRYYAAKREREKGGQLGLEELEQLLPLTVPEDRRLLWCLVWSKRSAPEHVLNWPEWRGRHLARARRSHYQRRLARYYG